MKRLILIASILLAFSLTAIGQSVSVKEVISSASDPSSCIVGKLYINTNSPGKVWARIGGTCVRVDGLAGGVTNSAGANVVPKSNGTNLVASLISDNGTTVTVNANVAIAFEGTPTLDISAEEGSITPRSAGTGGLGNLSTPFAALNLGDGANAGLNFSAPADGRLLLTPIGGAANPRLQLGGATSAFPAIKRNATAINFRLADDSADAPITAAGGTFSGQITNSLNGAASTPPMTLTGTWFTGGTSTTTKPQVLIEPTGATSSGWATSGTGLGVNAASGFSGNLIDLKNNGSARFSVSGAGSMTTEGNITSSNGGITVYLGANFAFNSRSQIRSSADGVIELANSANNSFTRLNFGGTTSSFPSLKRNSTAINVRLADDSADAPLTSSTFTAAGNGFIGFAARAFIDSPGSGILTLNDPSFTNFNRLQFGGQSSSYPSLKRNSTAINVRLADDTGDAPLTAGAGTFSNGVSITAGNLTLPDNVRQTFNPGSTNAGLNVGDQAGNPSSPSNGDIWNNSTTNTMMMRQNGVSVGVRPYKVWIALVTQSGTSAPTATVLENTLGGTVTLARTGVGSYTFTLTSAFPNNKTTVLYGGCGSSQCFINSSRTSDNAVLVLTQDINLSQSDDILNISTFEIRVYP